MTGGDMGKHIMLNGMRRRILPPQKTVAMGEEGGGELEGILGKKRDPRGKYGTKGLHLSRKPGRDRACPNSWVSAVHPTKEMGSLQTTGNPYK